MQCYRAGPDFTIRVHHLHSCTMLGFAEQNFRLLYSATPQDLLMALHFDFRQPLLELLHCLPQDCAVGAVADLRSWRLCAAV